MFNNWLAKFLTMLSFTSCKPILASSSTPLNS